jgi:hypothetical protein
MSLSSDFGRRLDGHLATLNEPAKAVFLRSQLATWQTRYRNFCHNPRPSAPGDVQPTATDFLLTIGEVQTRIEQLDRVPA